MCLRYGFNWSFTSLSTVAICSLLTATRRPSLSILSKPESDCSSFCASGEPLPAKSFSKSSSNAAALVSVSLKSSLPACARSVEIFCKLSRPRRRCSVTPDEKRADYQPFVMIRSRCWPSRCRCPRAPRAIPRIELPPLPGNTANSLSNACGASLPTNRMLFQCHAGPREAALPSLSNSQSAPSPSGSAAGALRVAG